jgi:hypothetical protein
MKVAAIAAVASVTLVGTAAATRRLPAWNGVVQGGGGGCIHPLGGPPGAMSTCGAIQVTSYVVPLPYDNSGSKTVSVTINGTNLTHCRALAASGDGTSFVSSDAKGGTGFGVWTRQTLSSISAPSHGQLYLSCDFLEPQGAVSVIEYNQ